MVYRKLGKTGLDVSLLSFGSHTDPRDRVQAGPAKTVLTEAGQARRDRILSRALDLGVNLVDVYASEGQWEPAERLLRGRRDKVLVSLAHEITAKEVDRAAKLFGHVDLYRFHAPDLGDEVLHNWDTLRKAKEAGKVRAIGIATHIESTMTRALDELDDLDYIYFPYNFIHARADYGSFLPRAVAKGVGLIAMKPLASGSIMRLDPRARAGAAPEFEQLQLWQSRNRPILPAAVAELTKSLDRMPDETLCMAAMRFVYGKPFISTAITGMFEMQLLEDNYKALERYSEMKPAETAALDAARTYSLTHGAGWLPPQYRWLEAQWRG
jgi:aryl-alcohol dehydrogenase-like predicted oxidoreductase